MRGGVVHSQYDRATRYSRKLARFESCEYQCQGGLPSPFLKAGDSLDAEECWPAESGIRHGDGDFKLNIYMEYGSRRFIPTEPWLWF